MPNNELGERLIVLGDLHQTWQSAYIIFKEALESNIDVAVNLGDEAANPFDKYDNMDFQSIWILFRRFRDASSTRRLICVQGNNTAEVPKDLFVNYIGVNEQGQQIEPPIWHEENIIAGHKGELIVDLKEDFITGYVDKDPLVVFHGHSHSMGVLPEFKWLERDEMVHWITEGKRIYNLEAGKVYWVNPGANNLVTPDGLNAANFAIYDRTQQMITLRSIFYDKRDFPRLPQPFN